MHTRIVLTLALTGAAALAPAQAQQLVISTYAGGPPATIPVLGVNTAIGSPAGATTDPAGNVYFISLYSGVFKLDRSGVLTRIAGTMWGVYALGYSGDGGPAINAQFCFPGYEDVYAGISGIAVDGTGNVYIADSGNHRVRKISSAGIVTTIAGNGEEGYLRRRRTGHQSAVGLPVELGN